METEKVCEKNCPDYNGMSELHKEQCKCSCHKAKETEKTKFIVYRESAIQSFLTDMGTFAWLLFGFWFNYKFISGSYIVNAILLIMFLMFLSARGGAKKMIFTTKEQVISYLNEK